MLVSILIATRKRIHRLIQTIESIYKTAQSGDFEIILRIDDDDVETLANLNLLKPFDKVRYIVGPRYRGYESHPVFMDELAEIARGRWCFFLDDDGVLLQEEGSLADAWDLQLADVPMTGKIVHPEFYWLGNSKYPSGSCEPVAICVPTKCWLELGWKSMKFPIDQALQDLLVSIGWENHWLRGLVAHHARDNEEVLEDHRWLPTEFFRTYIGRSAKRRIGAVLDKGWLNEGEQVRTFEKRLSRLLDLPNVLTTNSCSSSLLLCLLNAGVAGHEVIVPTQTFIATGMAVLAAGAKPVFADIDPETGNMCPRSLASLISERTKAIIVVHWAGSPCDMDRINSVAAGIPVIQDAAHALGATLRDSSIAYHSDYTCYSFQSIKHLTTGDGGAICTPQPNSELKKMKWFGIDKSNIKKDEFGGRLPDVDTFGFKWHMNDLSAALGLANLRGYRRRLQHRRRLASFYIAAGHGLRIVQDADPAYWMFTTTVKDRAGLCRVLKENRLPFSTVDYGIHRNPIFGVKDLDRFSGQDVFDKTQISFPVHDLVADKVVEKTIKILEAGW